MYSATDYASGASVKPYRVVVASTAVGLCPNGACVSALASAVPLAPAHLHFYAHNVRLHVTRVVITTP